MTTFRELIDAARARGVARGEKPRTISVTAAACRVARPYFYELLNGYKSPSDAVCERIADGLFKLSGFQTTARKVANAVRNS